MPRVPPELLVVLLWHGRCDQPPHESEIDQRPLRLFVDLAIVCQHDGVYTRLFGICWIGAIRSTRARIIIDPVCVLADLHHEPQIADEDRGYVREKVALAELVAGRRELDGQDAL